MLTLTVKGEAELRDLARDLRRGKGTLRSELTKAFKKGGNATLRRVKHNMTAMDIKGYSTRRRPAFRGSLSGTGLRARIARLVELDVRTGSADPRVRFEIQTGSLGNARNVPYHLDTGKLFRHPIMGNRDSWAASQGKPWFYQEIKSDLAIFEAECDAAIDRTIEKLERG